MARWLLVLALALLLAGCGGTGPAPAATASPAGRNLGFEAPGSGRQVGNEVEWSFTLVNRGNESSAGATLHIAVHFSRGPDVADERSTKIPALPPHNSTQVTLRTFYRGLGDYSGLAEVREGSVAVARTGMFFEQCIALC